jgi:hypothetical protein
MMGFSLPGRRLHQIFMGFKRRLGPVSGSNDDLFTFHGGYVPCCKNTSHACVAVYIDNDLLFIIQRNKPIKNVGIWQPADLNKNPIEIDLLFDSPSIPDRNCREDFIPVNSSGAR